MSEPTSPQTPSKITCISEMADKAFEDFCKHGATDHYGRECKSNESLFKCGFEYGAGAVQTAALPSPPEAGPVAWREIFERVCKKACIWCARDVPISDGNDGIKRNGRYHQVIGGFYECVAADERNALAAPHQHTSDEMVDAWEWRACIGGQWGAWCYLDQPIERFLDRNQFNLDNGTYELRPLYAGATLAHSRPDRGSL